MKKTMTRLLALALCLALCLALSVTAFAASTVTVSAGDISYSEQAQTVAVTIEVNPGADITAYGGNVVVPDGWSVSGSVKIIGTAEGESYTSTKKPAENSNYSFNNVVSDGMTATSVEITYNVPAGASGTFTLGAENLILSKSGANQLEGSNDGITATTTVTLTSPTPTPASGYGVNLSSDASEVAKGGSVNLYLDVTNASAASFNAFYATLTYDSALVSYSGTAEVSGFTVDSDTAGTLKLSKTGADVAIGDSHELTLPFTANAAGSASFTLANAKVDKAANAEAQNAPVATISGSPLPVTITETYTYSVTVTLGANMSSSGGLSQTGLTGAMTDVVVTPATGYELAAPAITGSGVTATANADGSYTISGTPTADVTVTFADATVKAPEATTSAYFNGYTLIAATIEADGCVPAYDGVAMFTVEGYDADTYYYVISGTYDAAKLGYATGTATNIAKSADVNQTGVIDINDAQFVYNIYNDGAAPTANVVQRLLLADVNRDKTVNVSDCAAVVAAID